MQWWQITALYSTKLGMLVTTLCSRHLALTPHVTGIQRSDWTVLTRYHEINPRLAILIREYRLLLIWAMKCSFSGAYQENVVMVKDCQLLLRKMVRALE